MSKAGNRLCALTIVSLMLIPGCHDGDAVAIAGEWTSVPSGDVSLRIANNGSGMLDFGSFSFEIEVVNSDAPVYTIEVADNADSDQGTILECTFIEPVLECPQPYAFRARRD